MKTKKPWSHDKKWWEPFTIHWKIIVQENYNTPPEHTPGNPPSQLWKESLYSLLVKVKGCVPVRCVETTLDIGEILGNSKFIEFIGFRGYQKKNTKAFFILIVPDTLFI